ncbi:tRNA (N6-isopentenyl adenosine(37)-C2)-methylthiotransferase MiaB [bacterium]|nr:tRNA (N6-isopentenyl adenosine(37)-C2)-methylthiotransferase MiaB [bacterium]
MNKNDSELIRGLLNESGYSLAEHWESADVVLVNTCSVREHAERRVLGRLGVLAGWKRLSPNRRIGVLGCMAQRIGASLRELRPCVDFIVGPDGYRRLPELISGSSASAVDTAFRPEELYGGIRPMRDSGFSAWVTVSRGCVNFCSYCIVPYTRGAERCRTAGDILSEIESLAVRGFREITLLGQNVNSWRDGDMDFADLLRRTAAVNGLLRVRFMTSHPKDLTERLLDAMAETQAVCPHLHLPVQSGSDRILERMNRKYDRKRYMEIVRSARERMPHLGLTTDIMVGFPGETEADFELTLDLLETVRFDDAYTYAYSPRSGTAAAGFEDAVPEDVRFRRLAGLIERQRAVTLQTRKEWIGRTTEILAERPSPRDPDEWLGRTASGLTVVFPAGGAAPGVPVVIRIEGVRGLTLYGRTVDPIDNGGSVCG